MSKSNNKALEENAALRRELRELRQQMYALQKEKEELQAQIELNKNGELHQ